MRGYVAFVNAVPFQANFYHVFSSNHPERAASAFAPIVDYMPSARAQVCRTLLYLTNSLANVWLIIIVMCAHGIAGASLDHLGEAGCKDSEARDAVRRGLGEEAQRSL